MNPIYRISHQVSTYDIDYQKRLRYANLFKYMQDAAQVHATLLGIGHAYLEQMHYAWILGRLRVQMNKVLHLGDVFYIETYPGSRMKYVYPRYFVFKDEQQQVIGYASSLWTIFDTQKREVVMTQEKIPYPNVDFAKPSLANPSQIELPILDQKVSYTTQYSDVDTNLHANNTNYIEWMMNQIDIQWMHHYYPESIQVNYLHEIAYHQTFIIHYTKLENKMYFQGKDGDSVLFTCEMKFKGESL